MKTQSELKALVERARAFHLARRGEGMLHRTIELDVDRAKPLDPNGEGGGADDVRLDIALSSEAPVERYDFWTDERYIEVLEHSPQAIDMTRTAGAPFLADHNARDFRSHMGVLENTRLDMGSKKLRARVRFSERDEAQAMRRDMQTGIRTKISIGYNIDPDNVEITRQEGQLKRYTYKRWTPLEGSSVAIPADEGVGVGRALDGLTPADLRRARALIEEMQRTPTAAATAEETRTVPETAAATAAGAATGAATAVLDPKPDPVAIRAEARAEEQKEKREIVKLANEHGMVAKLPEWFEKEMDLAAVRAAIMATYREKTAKSIADPGVVDLTEREQKRYNYQRGIDTQINAIEGKRNTTSFETEVATELGKNLPPGYSFGGGLLVPTCMSKEKARQHNMANGLGVGLRRQFGQNGLIATRTGLDTLSGSIGGDVVFTVPGEWLELLRNFMAVYAAGASYMTGLQGPIAFPQQITAATASWVAENPGSDVSDSNLTLQQVPLKPYTLQASTSYSRQLWIQSVVDIDAAVKQDLAAINALALDEAAIAGTGSGNQPTGITAWSGTASYVMGTNGATPAYVDLVGMETLITKANADQWPLSYLVHPVTRGTFKKAVPLSSTVGLPVWTVDDEQGVGPGQQAGGGSRRRGQLNGYEAWASAQVPSALTKGSSSGICLAGIFGAFPTLVIGDWGMFEIIVDPYRLKKQGMIELTTFAMYGIALKYAAAFCVCLDFLA